MSGTEVSVKPDAAATGAPAPADPPAVPSLDDPSLFVNREVSWLRFHERILEEAMDPAHPLLERVKFLAICGSNLDEFFMVRASGLRRQVQRGALKAPPDGMKPQEQLLACREILMPLLDRHAQCWKDGLLPALEAAGIHIRRIKDLGKKQRAALRTYFEKSIFPALTPLALDLAHPFPFISNLSLNLAVVINDPEKGERLARVKVPAGLFPRFVRVPADDAAKGDDASQVEMVFLEDLVASHLDVLFPGLEVMNSYPFRITRDAEIEIVLDEASDLLTAVEDSIETRRVGMPSRLEVDRTMPDRLKELFAERLGLPPYLVFKVDRPLGLVDFWALLKLDRPDLKDAPFIPFTPPELADGKDVFAALRRRDYVLYHPYDSFGVLLNLLREAAKDPDVLAIKITLYRIDPRSPVIDALMEARENGKDVAAIVELKAKFDEQNNIRWARALEHAGVHVVYGLVDYKVHAKLLLIVRRERDGMVRYSHLSSGNYNAVTTRVYGDIGYLTADAEVGEDLANLFNFLTGYSRISRYKRLLVAPTNLREEVLARIDREVEAHRQKGDGYIALKLNGLVQRDVVKALYRASMAGVKIDLNVRGLCTLRPGIPGVSENIRETSIVSRFLEHARIYYFRNGGEEEVLLGSSDLMPRNLFSRVEALVPVKDPRIRAAVIRDMLQPHLRDNVKARTMRPDGTYVKMAPVPSEEAMDSQNWLIRNRGSWHALGD